MQRITALDSIRGILLAWMAIDHWGGPISAQLYQRLGFWTAAEGFFFISGYVATQVALGKPDPQRWFLQRPACPRLAGARLAAPAGAGRQWRSA
jgi:peptidoglycan/LPS O-acetylase OafA/YrhL